jgi:hypothetical protein
MSSYLFPPAQQTFPFSNTNQNLVNPFATNNPIGFSSTQIPTSSCAIPQNNIQSANSYIPGQGVTTGGRKHKYYNKKTLKHKIKNIVRKYKMKAGKKMSLMKKIKRSFGLKGGTKKTKRIRHKGKHTRKSSKRRTNKAGRHKGRHMRGGYHQYMGNVPDTPSFSVGGPLPASQSALANPPPFQKLTTCEGNCIDSYNHFDKNSYNNRAGAGFQIWN